jgi:hypothetical protein
LSRTAEAKSWREQVVLIKGPHLFALHELAEQDNQKSVTQKQLRSIVYNVDLVDAAFA